MPKGCGAIALAGCALVLLLVGIGGVVMVLKADQLFSWAFDQVGDQIEKRLEDDVDPELRERLRLAIEEFSLAVREGRVTPDALSDAQSRLGEATRSSRISAEAALRLTVALERAARSQGEPQSEPEPQSGPAEDSPSEARGRTVAKVQRAASARLA